MLLITNRDVERLLSEEGSTEALIDVTESALAELGRGGAGPWPRVPRAYPPPEVSQNLYVQMGVLPDMKAMGLRIFTVPMSITGPLIQPRTLKLVFDFDRLNAVALIEDQYLHPFLVGAHVGVATRWLARTDASSVAMLGSGSMAMGTLRAICAVRPIMQVRVFSPTTERREGFGKEIESVFDVKVDVCATAEKAVSGADIVTCATNNQQRGGTAVFEREWISPGTHVNSVSRYEIDAALFGCARIVPVHLDEVVEAVPAWEPFATAYRNGEIPSENVQGDLASIVAGTAHARTATDDITVYLGPSLGVQHAALGQWVYEGAQRLGFGTIWVGDDASGKS